MTQINPAIGHILDIGCGDIFFKFSNADNKYWIIPSINTTIALNLYQPTSLKGKMVVKLFPFLKNISLFRNAIKVYQFNGKLNDTMYAILSQLFGEEDIQVSFFGGTPSIHQKITIQVFNRKRILGYCKITNSEEIKNIFYQENNILNTLKSLGVSNIPTCLYVGDYKAGYSIFIQTTNKTIYSSSKHEFSHQHWDFLLHLYQQTKIHVEYTKSDFYASLEKLKLNYKYIPNSVQRAILENIEKISNHFPKEVVFSSYHSDFTPWNMYFENGRLYVFDFEYTKMTYPPLLDWFHFFTQVCIFKYHMTPDQIINRFFVMIDSVSKYIDNPRFLYQCYLLDIISLYVNRDKGSYSKDVSKNLDIWTKLLQSL